ncbi:hypothetical protein BG004_001047 [Podila humilis]|nr:hypothetical protein BG004_001047 [Podila humilis]
MSGGQGTAQGQNSRHYNSNDSGNTFAHQNSPNYTLGSKQEFHEQTSYNPNHHNNFSNSNNNNNNYQSNYTYNNNNTQPQHQQGQFSDLQHDQGAGRRPNQQQQLQAQKEHQLRLQEQISAEDSLRGTLQQQQHRVPRQPLPTHGNGANNNNNTQSQTAEAKPPNYYSYPPHSSLTENDENDTTTETGLKARMRRLFNFPCSTYGKSMILVIGIEALLVIIMQAVVAAMYYNHLTKESMTPDLPPYLDTDNRSRSIPAYMIVFVFAQLFQLVLAWDAVRAQNTIEIIGIVIFNFCCFAYSIFEISQTKSSLCVSPGQGLECVYDTRFFAPGQALHLYNSIKPFTIVAVVVIGVTQCLVTWLAYQLFQEFGWKIYKKIGADPNMKKMYRAYQIYLVLIKIDLFFFVGFSIQFIYLTLANKSGDPEYWVTIFFLPATLLILMIAVYAVRHESRRWMAFFLTTMLAGVGYFIFKVVRMHTMPKMVDFVGIEKFLTLFAALCLVTILATIINATICYRNFGKGLKPHIMRSSARANALDSASSPNGRVLEID